MKASGLNEFVSVVADFKQIQALIFKGMAVAPLAGVWLKLGPPTGNITAALLTIVELLVLICAFQLWYLQPLSKLKIRFVVSTCVCFVGIVGIIYFFEYHTTVGTAKNRIVIGTRVRDDVSLLLGPNYTPLDALRDSEYDPTRVWTASSVQFVSILFDLTWLVAVMAYMASLATFTMLQRKKTQK